MEPVGGKCLLNAAEDSPASLRILIKIMSLREGTPKTTDQRELINTIKNKCNINNLVAILADENTRRLLMSLIVF